MQVICEPACGTTTRGAEAVKLRSSAFARDPNDRVPFFTTQVLRLTAFECPAMHRLRPTESNIEATFGEEPEGFLRSVVAGLFAIEEQRHLAVGELLGPASDLFDLMLSDAVRHDRDC